MAAAEVLEQLNKLLDEGLTDDQWREVARLAIKRVTVDTTVKEDGGKEVRVHVTYRFPGFVPTNTGTAASLNYTLLRRVIDLPTGRAKKRQ